MLMFADDAKMYCAVKSNSDSLILQNNLNKFYTWSETNHLPLNISKCQVISFTRNKKIIHFNYMLNNTNFTSVSVIKDLGIHFQSDLSFKLNHNIVINKAFKTLDYVNRNTQNFKNIICHKTLYCSLVRSSLEFGSLVRSQNLSTNNKDLENLQHKFLKRLAFVTNSLLTNESYKPIQESIALDSLQLKRQVADIIFIYNLLNGNIVYPKLLALINIRVPSYQSRNKELFIITFYKKNCDKN